MSVYDLNEFCDLPFIVQEQNWIRWEERITAEIREFVRTADLDGDY